MSPAVLPICWPRHSRVGVAITTRQGGVSEGRYAHANLATHVGDNARAVESNRKSLQAALGVQPRWLKQVHGTNICSLRQNDDDSIVDADGAVTRERGVACSVLTADCLPILICDNAGTQVAAVHAGWRGLAQGIIASALARFDCPYEQLNVFLGPCISQRHFEVGEEVLAAFYQAQAQRQYSQPVDRAFNQGGNASYFANLYALARFELEGAGVNAIYGGDYCTFAMTDPFFSYRRDGITGRFASLIWLIPE